LRRRAATRGSACRGRTRGGDDRRAREQRRESGQSSLGTDHSGFSSKRPTSTGTFVPKIAGSSKLASPREQRPASAGKPSTVRTWRHQLSRLLHLRPSGPESATEAHDRPDRAGVSSSR
jgi:hypothetical protein